MGSSVSGDLTPRDRYPAEMMNVQKVAIKSKASVHEQFHPKYRTLRMTEVTSCGTNRYIWTTG